MRLGIMCSGNGTNFENIVTNPICNKHEVVLMIHNTKQCGAVKRAAKWGIPHVRIPHKDEDRMIEMFKAWNVDLIILAGYMRVIKNPNLFPAPMINVHPSLLPKYKGLNTHYRALKAKEKFSGCTIHYVSKKLDSGKIIAKKKVKIFKKDTLKELEKRVLREENKFYPIILEKLIRS